MTIFDLIKLPSTATEIASTLFNALIIFAPIVISIIALRTAIRTRRDTNSNNRQQILTDKIEEVYEIVTELHYYYPALLFLHKNLLKSQKSEHGVEFSERIHKTYLENKERFLLNVDINVISKSTSRLRVLSNTCLTGDIQMRCLVYNDMFEKLIIGAIQQQTIVSDTLYSEGFPENAKLLEYLEIIQRDLVQLNKLGGESKTTQEIAKYRDSKFKKDLSLK